MHYAKGIVSFVLVVLTSGCVSAPVMDICSLDFDHKIQDIEFNCTPGDSSKPDYKVTKIEALALGLQCTPAEHYADGKSYLRHLLREVDE